MQTQNDFPSAYWNEPFTITTEFEEQQQKKEDSHCYRVPVHAFFVSAHSGYVSSSLHDRNLLRLLCVSVSGSVALHINVHTIVFAYANFRSDLMNRSSVFEWKRRKPRKREREMELSFAKKRTTLTIHKWAWNEWMKIKTRINTNTNTNYACNGCVVAMDRYIEKNRTSEYWASVWSILRVVRYVWM